VPHNETLATLGDAVLKLVFSLIFYERYPNISKGDLTECKKVLEADEAFSNLEVVGRLLPHLLKITDKTQEESKLQTHTQTSHKPRYEYDQRLSTI
jgi:dsRNA-specific ribonuclease